MVAQILWKMVGIQGGNILGKPDITLPNDPILITQRMILYRGVPMATLRHVSLGGDRDPAMQPFSARYSVGVDYWNLLPFWAKSDVGVAWCLKSWQSSGRKTPVLDLD